jgi:hypothetical protein
MADGGRPKTVIFGCAPGVKASQMGFEPLSSRLRSGMSGTQKRGSRLKKRLLLRKGYGVPKGTCKVSPWPPDYISRPSGLARSLEKKITWNLYDFGTHKLFLILFSIKNSNSVSPTKPRSPRLTWTVAVWSRQIRFLPQYSYLLIRHARRRVCYDRA